jgi:peptidoglycan/xylan/chitin deacetylase (PgdA/CDA1 family)
MRLFWRTARIFTRVAVVATALVVTIGAAPVLYDRPPPIGVTVRGEVRYLRPTVTFGDVQRRYRLVPEHGSLLDVDGIPLREDIYPGTVTVDGRRPVSWEVLTDGAVIEVTDAEDRTEPVDETVQFFPGGLPQNPQFILSRQPGNQITTFGRLSGKIVTVVFEPTGPNEIPPAVALTFDDGPHPTYTPQILAILRKHHVPATFFVVGYLAERFPDLIRREAAIGTVASHTWGHPISPPFRDLPPKRLREEIKQGIEAVEEQGLVVKLFRPPGGSYDDEVLRVAERNGTRLVMWSVDPEDWQNDVTRKQIVRSVIGHVRPGAIILLHDGGGDQSATVAALPTIIKKIRRMGLRFALVASQ